MLELFATAVGQGTVLDAGCGTGRIARFLSDLGCRVVGTDLSAGMLAMARRDGTAVPVCLGSLRALPFADRSVDGVVLWYSVIHTPPDVRPVALAEAARVLRPGGHVLVGFQHGTGTVDVSDRYRELGHDVSLVRYRFTADEIAGELADVGLREVARVVRVARPGERDDQAAVVARSVLEG
jgi:SAM-dependent methyltransferase